MDTDALNARPRRRNFKPSEHEVDAVALLSGHCAALHCAALLCTTM